VKASSISLATRPLKIQRPPAEFKFRRTRAVWWANKKPLMFSVVVAENVKGFSL